ncbi:c-type cytochrome [Inquilinus limosus]|uniref:c-type cytochrome n=1 Tax=Inquilinus limosus TaxID=171674 RepID=UPI000412F59A|nr:c-type cytochrome [Inquilinus limosus]
MTIPWPLAALVLLAAAAPAAAQPSGAASCSGCHGPAGAETGLVPPLEGRPAAEIAAAMAAFRSGERPATVMDRIAKGFTDEETRAIAEWLANERDHAGP